MKALHPSHDPRRDVPPASSASSASSPCPGDAEDPVNAARLGHVLAGKWRLERVLGAGGMATVYAASHHNNLRPVAVKVLHSALSADDELRKRFLREGYIANRVGHPNAVAVLDDGEDEDERCVYLVMDLLSGMSLHERQVRAGGVLGASEALRVAEGVLDVLVAAHEQGIIHRDLKPDNVFLTDEGAVKVLDFGIARLTDGGNATQTGLTIGTPAYMPPEQARGRSSEVGPRSDVWAVGAILFTLLAGHHVHEGDTPNETLLKAMTAKAPPLRWHAPFVPEPVARIVDHALAFSPDDRFPSAAAMRDAIVDARGQLPAEHELVDPAFASARTAVARSVRTPPTVKPLSRPTTGSSSAVSELTRGRPSVLSFAARGETVGARIKGALRIAGFVTASAAAGLVLVRAGRPHPPAVATDANVNAGTSAVSTSAPERSDAVVFVANDEPLANVAAPASWALAPLVREESTAGTVDELDDGDEPPRPGVHGTHPSSPGKKSVHHHKSKRKKKRR